MSWKARLRKATWLALCDRPRGCRWRRSPDLDRIAIVTARPAAREPLARLWRSRGTQQRRRNAPPRQGVTWRASLGSVLESCSAGWTSGGRRKGSVGVGWKSFGTPLSRHRSSGRAHTRAERRAAERLCRPSPRPPSSRHGASTRPCHDSRESVRREEFPTHLGSGMLTKESCLRIGSSHQQHTSTTRKEERGNGRTRCGRTSRFLYANCTAAPGQDHVQNLPEVLCHRTSCR